MPLNCRTCTVSCEITVSQDLMQCEQCGRTVRAAAIVCTADAGHRRRFYCVDCAEELNIDQCPDCGDYHSLNIECPSDRRLRRNVINDYNYTPRLKFMHSDSSSEELFLGVELEIARSSPDYGPMDQHTSSHLGGLATTPEWCYTKYDGSVSAGYEIVSMPMSVSWANQHIHELTDTFPELRKLGYISGESTMCGMHIHMSRAAFTHLHLYKFMYTVYYNSSMSLLLSQRDVESFTRWARPVDDRSSIALRAKHKRQCGRNRHDAVNLSDTKPTVELRIFKGTLNEYTFRKNIQTALALYRFSQDTSLHNLSAKHFVEYVLDNHNLYRELGVFLLAKEQRDLIFSNDTPSIPEQWRIALNVHTDGKTAGDKRKSSTPKGGVPVQRGRGRVHARRPRSQRS